MKHTFFIILIILLFSLTSTAQESKWWKDNRVYSFESSKFDKWDKTLYTSFTALQIVDMLQTNYIFEHPEKYQEAFPLARWAHRNANDAGIIGCFVIGNIAAYQIAKHLKPVPRKVFLSLVTALQIDSTEHNRRAGVKFSYSFSF